LNNTGTIGGGNITANVTGNFTNKGNITTKGAVKIFAVALDNLAPGTIGYGTVLLNASKECTPGTTSGSLTLQGACARLPGFVGAVAEALTQSNGTTTPDQYRAAVSSIEFTQQALSSDSNLPASEGDIGRGDSVYIPTISNWGFNSPIGLTTPNAFIPISSNDQQASGSVSLPASNAITKEEFLKITKP
jgi:hypothetical protein